MQSLRELKQPTGTPHAPRIQSWTLKQGSRVLFVENHHLPMVDLKISFAAGSYYDGETPGLAAMTQALFSVDSARKPADAIARGFNRYGAQITHGINAEQSYMTLRSLSAPEVLAPVMNLFTETLTQRAFSEDNLSRIRRSLQSDLKLEHVLAQARALASIRAELYAGQPLSRSTYGTNDSLQRIQAAQVIPLLQIAGRHTKTGSYPGNGVAGTHLIASAGQRRIIRELRRLYGGNVARGQRFTQLCGVLLRHHDVLWPARAQR